MSKKHEDDLNYLVARLMLWRTLYIMTSIAFVGATATLCYMTLYELINNGNPFLFIVGNIPNIILCLVLLLVSTFFGITHDKTKAFLDKKIKTLMQSRQ